VQEICTLGLMRAGARNQFTIRLVRRRQMEGAATDRLRRISTPHLAQRTLNRSSPWCTKRNCASLARKDEPSRIKTGGSGGMREFSWQHFKRAFLILLTLVAAAGWLYVIYNQERSNDPMEVVKKRFVFYPEYSHGVWREKECAHVDGDKCREVTYTIPVKGCGPVTFDWLVSTGEGADAAWTYNGTDPRLDESKYPLYAVLNEDARLIDSPALGKPLPETCQFK
jgi:hypothetical protein